MRGWMTAGTALALLWLTVGGAQAQDDRISLKLKDSPLGDAVNILHDQTGLQFVFGPDVDQDKKITISVDDAALEKVLQLLLEAAGGLQYEKVQGVYIIKTKGGDNMGGQPAAPVVTGPTTPRPSRPGPAPTRPADRGRPGATPAAGGRTTGAQPATGQPTVAAKRYELIKIYYSYAPGLATAFSGQALLYSDMDPWASGGMGGQGGQGGQGGFGGQGGGGGGFGGGGFGGGGGGLGGGGLGGGGGGGFGGGGGGLGGGGGGFGGGGRGGGGGFGR